MTADVRAGLDVLGLGFILDANIATNLGAGTNEDRAVVFAAADMRLWEDAPRFVVSTQSAANAGTLEAVIVVRKRAALMLNRYPTGLNVISGAGMAVTA